MRKVLAGVLAAGAIALVAVTGVSAAPGMLKGFYDEGLTLGYPDDYGFRVLKALRAQALRMNLYWNEVARSKPAQATDDDDPAYDWSDYDEAVLRAAVQGVQVVFSIVGTPGWANGGKAKQYAPTDMKDLEDFAEAAATRYDGFHDHPRVRYWIAWNEPNGPTFLRPQSENQGGQWVFTSPQIYAQICDAIAHSVNKVDPSNQVACGAFNPRGKLRPNGNRDSVAPVIFMEQMKQAGGGTEADVWAIHPYSPTKNIKPNQRIRSNTTVVLGNIDVFIDAVDRLYGRTPIWVTEYGYQTNPPDRRFGVSWKTQAKYLTQAFAIGRKNPRIEMFLWFQIKDEPRVAGWQSGVISSDDKRKPSYNAFRKLPR